jgi:hypothetical protein
VSDTVLIVVGVSFMFCSTIIVVAIINRGNPAVETKLVELLAQGATLLARFDSLKTLAGSEKTDPGSQTTDNGKTLPTDKPLS